MNKLSLDALVREQMARASTTGGGRSADTVYGGHDRALRQTILALTAGSTQTEHENPGEATVYVLRGRVRLARGPPGRARFKNVFEIDHEDLAVSHGRRPGAGA